MDDADEAARRIVQCPVYVTDIERAALTVARAYLELRARMGRDGVFVEADRIMAMTDAEVRAKAVAELGSEEAVAEVARDMRAKMLATVYAHMADQAPTPDPAVMRDYIDRLTRFFIDQPEWVALAGEARGYIGALSAPPSKDQP